MRRTITTARHSGYTDRDRLQAAEVSLQTDPLTASSGVNAELQRHTKSVRLVRLV